MTVETFERERSRILGLAYRMTGSLADAEDVVQEAWLRWSRCDQEAVVSARSFLLQIATRLSLDRLKSAQRQREEYVGAWLPEPVADAEALSPESGVELAEDLSFALLLALERLSPLERASFLLHDVCDYTFQEVAEILERSPAACRQLASRARRRMKGERSSEGRPGPEAKALESHHHARLVDAFARAVEVGDVAALRQVLANDAVLISDGGGRVPSARRPVRTSDHISRFLVAIYERLVAEGVRVRAEPRRTNGQPALWIYGDDELIQVTLFELQAAVVQRIYAVRNPGKLAACLGAER